MSIGILTRARIEQRATPITNMMIVSGRRSAARSSHILTALPASYREEPQGMAADLPVTPLRPPNSATRRAAQERHRFRLARAGFGRPQRQPTLPTLLGNGRVP